MSIRGEGKNFNNVSWGIATSGITLAAQTYTKAETMLSKVGPLHRSMIVILNNSNGTLYVGASGQPVTTMYPLGPGDQLEVNSMDKKNSDIGTDLFVYSNVGGLDVRFMETH